MAQEWKFGEGKISGSISLALSILCLGAVLCFHFPDILTTPQLREVYPVDFLRTLLSFSLFLSFGFGLLSFLLSKRKWLSLSGIWLTVVALLLGGSQVQVEGEVDKSLYVGLDWFILDILIVSLIFIPLERVFARIKEQKIIRYGFYTDLMHFFVSHLLIQLTSVLILSPAVWIANAYAYPAIISFITNLHFVIQFVLIVILADLVQYWVHRAFHKIPWLWKFHAIHHSAEYMDWLAGSRLHLVDIVITRGLTLIPIYYLGFSLGALHAYLIFVAFFATFIHTNVSFKLRYLEPILVTPRYHHWHHGSDRKAVDVNYAVHLTFLDKIFGTYYFPKDQWPQKYGLLREKLKDSYWYQLIHPFR